MRFGVIIGGVGSGKSERIEQKIETSINAGRNALVIVPERFSHIEERTLCEHFGGLGLNGIEASTFSKLSARMANGKDYLLPSGREMIILKAIKRCINEGDEIFKGAAERVGFVGEISNVISELKKSMISSDSLKSYSGDGLLKRKMTAIGAIYEEYNRLVVGKYSDPDENISELSEIICSSEEFVNTDVYIDGFTDFMPAHYAVIAALVKNANSVTVALTVNDSAFSNSDGIFSPVFLSMSKLEGIAKDLDTPFNIERLSGEYKYIKSDDIKYFLKNFDEYTDLSPAPKCENIKLKAFNSRYDEVVNLAGDIMTEVREKGLRFRDIGVIVGNSDEYLHIIDSVFENYNIPYSQDSKIAATEHPVVRLVLSAFKIIIENWSYSSVFEYLRSGFLYCMTDGKIDRYDSQKIDKLEIYVKSRGIRGKNVWLSEEAWRSSKPRIFDEATGGRDTEEDIDELNNIRCELVRPFLSFTEKIKGRQKASALAEALFEFLEETLLFQGILIEKQRFEEANMLDDSMRLATVWNTVLEVLDQAVMTFGDEFMSRDDFYHLLEAGFSKCSIDIVPSGADRVAVSGADTNRPVRVKTLFVVGAVRGELPQEASDFGIITATDRTRLAEAGIEGLTDKALKSAVSEFNLFSSLTAGYERLYISYPEYNSEGAKNAYAPIIGELLRFFDEGDLTKSDNEFEKLLASRTATYNIMMSRLGSEISVDERMMWDSLWEILSPLKDEYFIPKQSVQNEDYSIFEDIEAERLDMLSDIQSASLSKSKIRPETAATLYGERSFSVSALQKFNSCPFSYFADYGLRLKGDEERKVRASDIGTMVHWAICEYCRIVQAGADTDAEKKSRWKLLEKPESDSIIEELTSKIAEITKQANPDFGEERIELMCKKTAEVIKRSAEVIRLSLTEGEFVAYEFEKPFKFTLENNKGSIELSGTIDRADIADCEYGKLLRIIDYKTGNQSFSVAGVYNKTDLQLIIYALAAENLYREDNAKVSAVMYDKITDELKKTEIGAPFSVEHTQLDGIIIHDDKNPPEEEILIHTKELAEGGAKSRFLHLSTKKKGGLVKNNTMIPRSGFNVLRRYVTKTTIEAKNDIYAGRVGAYPLGEGEYSPCTWCEYSSICMHDKKRDGIRKPVTKADKAWEMLDAEDKADE